MSNNTSPVYSQGFNFGSFIQKGVDPRTGQYTCSIDLYETLPLVRNCSPFKLSLDFNPMNSQNYGLGKGWSFSLPSIEHRQGSPTVNLSTGESYRVVETPNSISVIDQKLKSSSITKLGSGLYQIAYKSGQVEILSNANNTYNKTVISELYSLTGRLITFKWTRSGEQPRLQSIEQGNEVLVRIEYTPSQTIITRAPDTTEACVLTLAIRNDQLQELLLPLGNRLGWTFVYEQFGSTVHLKQVTNPSGNIEDVQYRQQGHRLPTGAPMGTIPYVISHTVRPGVGQPSIRTTYTYSDKNFMGFNGTHNWKNGEDNLFNSPNDYEYYSISKIEGGTETKCTYNKFHLMILSEEQKGTKQVVQKTVYHALPFTAFQAQPAQFQFPKTVETTYRDKATGSSRSETASSTFDEWGNPTSEIQPNGIRTERVYYPHSGDSDCPRDPHGFQRYIKTETVTPKPSDHKPPTRSESYTYSQISCAAGGKTPYFVVVRERQSMANKQTLTATQYKYVTEPGSRDLGRLIQETTFLLNDCPSTIKWTYSYPNSKQYKQTATTTAHDGSIVTEETIYSIFTGSTLSHQSETGKIEQFSYDAIGRIQKKTTSPGSTYEKSTSYDYTVLLDSKGYCETMTHTKGGTIRYIKDGLDRLCRVEQRATDKDEFRITQEHSYNAQNQCIATYNSDWLQKGNAAPVQQRHQRLMEYDDWGAMCKAVENTGLVRLSNMDPISRVKIEGIQGEGMTRSRINDFGAPDEVSLLKGDKEGTFYSKVSYEYDTIGRLVNQEDEHGRKTAYQYDAFDRIIETRWPNDRVVKTMYAKHTTAALAVSVEVNGLMMSEQSFDGLGRLVRKATGHRVTTQTYSGIHPEPSEVTTSKGDTIRLHYAQGLDYVPTKVSSGGASDDFQYNTNTGTLTQSKSAHCTHDLQYHGSGQLAKELFNVAGFDKTFTTSHSYSMTGKLQEFTDVHGQKQEVQYDAVGRPQTIIQDKFKVSLAYDKANRQSEVISKDEATNAKLTTSITYDDFGREINRKVKKGENTLLFDITQTYNKLSLITTRTQRGPGGILRDETFTYDVYNRLTGYECSGSQPPVSSSGRSLRKQTFTFDKFDNISQCWTEHQDGTTNNTSYIFSPQDPTQMVEVINTDSDSAPKCTLQYDQNGCLIRDEQGRRLEYNEMSRLTAVKDSNNKTLAEYCYDAGGKLTCQKIPDQPDTHLFYRGESLVAVKKGDKNTSYMSDGYRCWGETVREPGGKTKTNLWAADSQHSILATLDTQDSAGNIQHQQYGPYGSSSTDLFSSSLGFHGQWRDPITGWYHLGNGYRVYNPVLMRFHSPDPWSPFTSGEINPYAYCLGDAINRTDPNGHSSFTDWVKDRWNWGTAIWLAGIAISIVAGVLTGGASMAVQIGVGIAVGCVVGVASGMINNAIEGKPITWTSVGIDLGISLAAGIVGAAAGYGVKKGLEGMKSFVTPMFQSITRSGSLAITVPLAESTSGTFSAALASTLRGTLREFIPSEVTSQVLTHFATHGSSSSTQGGQGQSREESAAAAASRPLGRNGPTQVGSPRSYLDQASPRARDVVRPAMKDGDARLAGTSSLSDDSTSLSVYGVGTGLGQATIANLLNRDTRVVFFGPSMGD